MRKNLQLGELKPNPFKKNVNDGKLRPETVAAIQGSAEQTSLWEQWVARKNGDGYELAFGHHRLEAAINLFGRKHEVSVQVEPYTDAQMLKALANENAESDRASTIRDTLLVARKFLIDHPEECKFSPATVAREKRQGQHGCDKDEHGTAACIAKFLSDKSWSERTIQRYLGLAADVAEFVADKDKGRHAELQGKIPLKAAVAISQLPTKEIRKAAVSAIRRANKEELVITAKAVKAIVNKAKYEPVGRQKKIIEREIDKFQRFSDGRSKASDFFLPLRNATEAELKEIAEAAARNKHAYPFFPQQKKIPKEIIATAEEVVEAGLRVLALKRHPDHGGSEQAMQLLNRAVQWLRYKMEKETE